jgi:protocatechuate 3,4-dioxygenase beta subunit
MEEGPYFIDEKLLRSDVRSDPTTGVVQPGVLLTLAVTVQNQSGGVCAPLAGAYVDLWEANASGIYSDEVQENTSGQKYLRGYQITDDNGLVQFTTIYPGWYSGRAVHIHLRVRTYPGTTVLDSFETQTFFNDSVTNTVYTKSPYNARGTRDTLNATDHVYTGASNAGLNLWTLTQTGSGYAATLNLAVSMKTPAATAPAISSGGVVNAASGAATITPGSWVSIYGTNLAATTYALASTDIVNNLLPTTLSGVSVQIDGKAAYLDMSALLSSTCSLPPTLLTARCK